MKPGELSAYQYEMNRSLEIVPNRPRELQEKAELSEFIAASDVMASINLCRIKKELELTAKCCT